MTEVANPLEGLRLDGDALGEAQPWVVVSRGLEYPGEVIVAETVNPDWGRPLEGDLLFRIVLYTVPRRIPPDQIRDPRIAMAVPRRAPDVVQQSVGRQLQAIREAKERYAAGHDPDSQAIRESMAGQESSLQSDLARREAHSYSQGRVYTQSGLAIRASEIFTETAAATWVERLVRAVHQLAYPTLPIEYAEFPGVLDAARVEEVFRGILQGDVAGADSARGFDAGGCEVVDIIGVELESRAGEMAAADRGPVPLPGPRAEPGTGDSIPARLRASRQGRGDAVFRPLGQTW